MSDGRLVIDELDSIDYERLHDYKLFAVDMTIYKHDIKKFQSVNLQVF